MMKIYDKPEKIFILSLILVLFLIIFGCGGGGSGSGSSGSGVSESSSSNDSGLTTSTDTDAVTLAWDAPTTNSDGSELNDLSGYKIYYGTSSGSYTTTDDIGNSTTVSISNLAAGNWCFAVTAYDTSGNESDYSNEVCTTIE